jgi:hypothetical protein
MKGKYKLFFLSTIIIIANVIGAPSAGAAAGYTGNEESILMAYLSANQEIAKVDIRSQGRIIFYLSNDSSKLYYKLNLANIRNVTSARIHLTAEGDDGPAVAVLFDMNDPWTKNINSAMVEGTISNDNLIGPLYGQPLSALLREMGEGYTFLSIYTKEYPGGHVRGRIIDPSNY